MARLCPELNSIYIYRRQLLQDKVASLPLEEAYALLAQEMKLLGGLLREMPKSYSLWNHRKWVILQSLSFQVPYEESLIS